MALTEKQIANARPAAKPYKLFDAEGLYLLVQADGAKYWRLKFRFAGKEKLLALGVYPAVALAEARRRRTKAKAALADGRDPSAERQFEKRSQKFAAENTFQAVATAWHEANKGAWSVDYADWIVRQFKADVYPWLGRRPIAELGAPDLLQVIRQIEQRDALVVAHRCRANCDAVFAFAIAAGLAQRNPAAEIRRALKALPEKRHHASVKDPKAVGQMLRVIEGYRGQFITKSALRLAPLVFVRPGELRKAEWSEFDLDACEWRIPGPRMKMRQPHIVPLATQAAAILRELEPLTGGGKYVFPGVRSRQEPMSENTLNAALRRLDYGRDEMTAHGFRSMASTLLNEAGWNRDAIERQLAHVEKNKVRAAYNAAEYLPERRKMMQAWADYLDGLAAGARVTSIRRVA